MKPSFTTYIVPAGVKQRLEELLQKADTNSIIGVGIQIHLQKNSIDGLIAELQSLADENPAHVEKVIGHEAMKLIRPDL